MPSPQQKIYGARPSWPPPEQHVRITISAAAARDGELLDFPPDRLAPYHIEAKHPDDFVIDTLDISPGAVAKVIADQAAALKSPPRSVGELLDTFRDQGLVRSVAKLRELFGAGDT